MPDNPGRLARLNQAERAAAVAPFAGRRCVVTYRTGSYAQYDQRVTGVVAGASYHLTNGTSTGDLVLVADRGHHWNLRDARWQAVSIALANVGGIELAEAGE
jgi:hypothetical protein